MSRRPKPPEPPSNPPSKVLDPPAENAPGMVWIPGGEFSMGAAEFPGMNMVGMEATTDSRPIHRVFVDGFWMDTTEVTNAQFAKFVAATGYVTIAERAPRAEDFPGAPPENLVAGCGRLLAAWPSRPAERSPPVVVVREARRLASSRRARQQHRGPRALSGRAGRL